MKEIAITKITPSSQPIYKGITHSGRRGFVLDITYTLADGRDVPSSVRKERKKDVLPALAREIANAASGAQHANLSDTGEFWGTVTRYSLGTTGLIPTLPEPTPLQPA